MSIEEQKVIQREIMHVSLTDACIEGKDKCLYNWYATIDGVEYDFH